ncbi:MAG: putative lipid II flippase FtsW [Actinomycetota bacterium]|nr:putative lipid II flippase FtsW [Actinomycetota bacterium]
MRAAGGHAAATRSAAQIQTGHPAALIAMISCLLVVVGLVMILSASSVTSFANYGSSFLFFKRQLVWAVAGMALFVLFCRLDYRRLKGLGYVLYPIALLLLVITLIPGVGVTVGGGTRWIALGALSFQPSELAKLALVLLSADVFSRKQERLLQEPSHMLIPMVPALGLMAGLVLRQPDLGTTLLLGSIGIGMLFLAGAPLRFLFPLGAAGAAIAAVAALSAPYRRVRVLAFMDPWADPLVTGYHTIQSLIALGSGGWLGVGLGASRQKWMYIPNAHTDFIFAILGEEMGVVGTVAVLGMFALLAFLGMRASLRAPDRFGMLLGSGIVVWISVQALVNIGAVTAVLPITGVPLPLLSFGGSSLVLSLTAMGILTNIAWQGTKRELDDQRMPQRSAASRRRRR